MATFTSGLTLRLSFWRSLHGTERAEVHTTADQEPSALEAFFGLDPLHGVLVIALCRFL
jgi:hypothetical protein